MRSDLNDGQHVRVVNPETGALVCDDAVIIPRPFYSSDSGVMVLQHHQEIEDDLAVYPSTWLEG
jgi:hypothetical protein